MKNQLLTTNESNGFRKMITYEASLLRIVRYLTLTIFNDWHSKRAYLDFETIGYIGATLGIPRDEVTSL